MPVIKGQLPDQVVEAYEKRLQKRLKDSAEYQRRSQMTREERVREAKDRMVKSFREHNEKMGDTKSNPERQVENLTRRFVREVEK